MTVFCSGSSCRIPLLLFPPKSSTALFFFPPALPWLSPPLLCACAGRVHIFHTRGVLRDERKKCVCKVLRDFSRRYIGTQSPLFADLLASVDIHRATSEPCALEKAMEDDGLTAVDYRSQWLRAPLPAMDPKAATVTFQQVHRLTGSALLFRPLVPHALVPLLLVRRQNRPATALEGHVSLVLAAYAAAASTEPQTCRLPSSSSSPPL